MRMMLHEESVVTLLSAILGSSALGGIGGWMAQKLKRYQHMVTSDDLKPIEEKLDRDYEHMNRIDRGLLEFRLTQLRQCLFAHPFDQNSHQSAIESGEMYIKLGGNGVGHKRLAQLVDNYEHRVETDDWDYTHNRP